MHVKITGAVHARYQITEQSSKQRRCYTTTYFAAYGIWMWFGGFGKLPDLSIQKAERNAATSNVSLARSPALSVGFVEHRAKVWTAGYEKDLATGRGRNFGSGSVAANAALTKGRLAAKLVWDGDGPRVRPIRIIASWDCERHASA